MMNDKKRWTEFIFLSLAIHFIILFFILDDRIDYKHLLGLDGDKEKPVDVYVIDGTRYRQIVGLDDDAPGDKEENKDARYLGKVNRRVYKETQAKRWGRTQNRTPKVQYIVQEDLNQAIGDYLNKKKSHAANKNKPNSSSNNYGESTSYDYLPGVASGDDTILNTAEFVYFSFYKRVEDAVVYLWNKYVADFINKRPDVRENLGKRDYITEVEAVIDRDGNFVKMGIVKSSGVAGIDEAPGRAFMDSSPFVNPPDGMVGQDGLIRMRWRFVVSVVESLRLKVQEINPNDYLGRPDPALERQTR